MSRVKFSPFFVACSTKEELSACWKHLSGTYGDIQRRNIDSRAFVEPVIIYCKRWFVDGVPRGNIRILSMDSMEHLENSMWYLDGFEVHAVKINIEDVLKGVMK